MNKWIEIDGTDVKEYLLKWRKEETFGDTIRDISVTMGMDVYNAVTLTAGQTIHVKRGLSTGSSDDYWVFNGFIDTINKMGSTVEIKAKDQLIKLVRASVNYSYDMNVDASAGVGSEIAKDLIETHGGMTATVVATPSALLIKKLICRGTDVYSRLKVLADIYDYQLYYDPNDDTVHFEPKGYVSRTNPVTVGVEVLNVPKWEVDATQLVNRLVVKGAVQEVQDTESFNGDGAETTFSLSKKPISTNVVVDGSEMTPGVDGSTTGSYDYTVDKENKNIVFESGSVPGVGVNNIVVKYVNAIPVPVQVENTESIDTYGLNRAEKFYDDIQTVADAEARGVGFIDKFSVPFTRTTIAVNGTYDFEAGEKIRVIDNINSEDQTLVINKIVQEHPYKFDQLTLGNKEWRTADWGVMTLERIRRLEESLQMDAELLVQVHRYNRTIVPHRRYVEIVRSTFTTFKFWGHVKNPWNSSAGWAASNTETETDVQQRLFWPAHTYVETFMDDDFKGTGTATWSTAQKKLIF